MPSLHRATCGGVLARAGLLALGLCAAGAAVAGGAATAAPTNVPPGGPPAAGSADEGPPILVTPRATPGQAAGQGARLLGKAAAQGGRLRVIVGIDHQLRDEDGMTWAQTKAQRARLAAAQAALVGRVARVGPQGAPGAPLPPVHAYGSIPYVALEADVATLRRLLADPKVVSVQEDTLASPSVTQSVPLIRADQAWIAGHTGRGLAVAVLDTGVEARHPMLVRKLVSEACYSTTATDASWSLCPGGAPSATSAGSGASCPATVAGCGHGTHVAGIAVGNAPNLKGVARDGGIISIQVFSRVDDPATCAPGPAPCALAWFSDIVRGLERVYALRGVHKIAAANLSLGGGAYAAACDAQLPAVKAVIDKLRAARIATVVASGNGGSDGTVGAPACISSAVAVGSTSKADVVSSFSDHSSLVDLLAPGEGINSALPGGAYAYMSGTSMAAPHVAGAFAVMKQAQPLATVDQIQGSLAAQGRPVARAGIVKPRIDVQLAANALKANTKRNAVVAGMPDRASAAAAAATTAQVARP